MSKGMLWNISQLKTSASGGIVAKGRNGVVAKCVYGGGNGFVDEMFCRGFVFWRFLRLTNVQIT